MIEKRIEVSIEDTFWDSWNVDEALVKSASFNKEGAIPKVAQSMLNREFDPRFRYILVSALGSGEFWGPNLRGDYFPEEDLLGMQNQNELRKGDTKPVQRIKTFLTAKYFRRHRNKKTDPNFGHVVDVVFDPEMHKVILLIAIDKEKAPDIIDRVDNGELTAVSMGCNVKYDVCSICGNKAKTLKDYCKHLKYEMGKVYPDGRKAFAINTTPYFFDISDVVKPAWEGGYQLRKIASMDEEVGYQWENDPNRCIMTDRGNDISDKDRLIGNIIADEPHLPKIAMEKLAEIPLQSALGAFSLSGIIPKPSEFSYLVYRECGMDKEAEAILGKDMYVEESTGADEIIVKKGTDAVIASSRILNKFAHVRSENTLPDRAYSFLVKEASLSPKYPDSSMNKEVGNYISSLYQNFVKKAGFSTKSVLALSGLAAPHIYRQFHPRKFSKSTAHTLGTVGFLLGAGHKGIGKAVHSLGRGIGKKIS